MLSRVSQDLHPRMTHLHRVADFLANKSNWLRYDSREYHPWRPKRIWYKRACSDLTEIDSQACVSWRSPCAPRSARVPVPLSGNSEWMRVVGKTFYNIRRLVLVGYSNMARARRLEIHGPIGSCARKGGGRGCEGRTRKEKEMKKETTIGTGTLGSTVADRISDPNDGVQVTLERRALRNGNDKFFMSGDSRVTVARCGPLLSSLLPSEM